LEAAVKEKIFEPFFTTKELGKGTGISLATVHEIVQSCARTISVESTPGCGTRFDIDFPATESLVEKGSRSVTEAANVPELVVQGSIVVCEDDESVSTAVCDYLEAMAADVIRCGSATEAMAAAQLRRPAVLITDVIMPGQSGVQLAQELRSLHSGLRVLSMTGHTEHDVLKTIGPARDTRFIQKPFTTASLMEQLRQVTADA
jgi:CheY-like chemotaxis protein